ncbi:MAG: sodium:solute symporter family protein [Fimbriimonadaceae bacterium]|nr:sodium:solute symporter family protein [Fimbriimonadaceae bacterium]
MDPLAHLNLSTNFGAVDWVIVILFLVASTVAGLYAQRFIRTMSDYVVADRAVQAYLGVATIIATEMGLVTVMYSAQKGFTLGFAAFHIALIACIMALIVGRTGFIVVPLRRSGAMTIPEYYEQRYGRGVRVLGGLILAFSGILNMGMFLKADSLFVTAVMGIADPTALKLAMTIMLALVLLYTCLGGMMAVLVTDYLQFVVMGFSLVVVSVFLMLRLGWGDVVSGVENLLGPAGFNPLHEGSVGPTYVLWMCVLGLVSCGLWQTSALRASAAADEEVVKKTFSWGAVGFLIRFLVPYFWGLCALVYLGSQPALRDAFLHATGPGAQEVSLRAMPIALAQLVPAGLIGILTAGMLAAAMSTYNTYLHAWSAVLTQDVLAPLLGDKLTERGRIRFTQAFMVAQGIFLLVWGLWYQLGEDLWDYMALTGAVYFCGAIATLVGGLYWRGARKAGAYGSFACGFLALLGLGPVKDRLGITWSGEAIGLFALGMAIVVFVVGSVLTPRQPGEEG